MRIQPTNKLDEKEVERKLSEIASRDHQRIISLSSPFSSLKNQDWVGIVK